MNTVTTSLNKCETNDRNVSVVKKNKTVGHYLSAQRTRFHDVGVFIFSQLYKIYGSVWITQGNRGKKEIEFRQKKLISRIGMMVDPVCWLVQG